MKKEKQLDEKILQDVTPEKRSQYLRDSADKIEKLTYLRKFTADEIIELKDELSSNTISLSEIQERFDEVKKEYKLEMKPIQIELKTLITNIKQKGEFVKDDVFILIDHDAQLAGYYNSEGVLVDSRALHPSELQKTIHMANRTGTDSE